MTRNLLKPVNLLLAGYSYLKCYATGRTGIKGMPVSVGIELTNECNLHCPFCSSGSGLMERERGFMDIRLFRKVMKELSPYLYNVNLYFQGEPMLHPLFFSFLESSLKLHTVVSTNGHFLTEESSEKIVRSGLSKLIISLDGTDQETYSKYRINGNLMSVIDGLKNVTKAKKKHGSSLKITIQFLVNKFNEHQVSEVSALAKNLHTSLSLKSMQIMDKKDMDSWLPSDQRFRRYKSNEGQYVIKSSLRDRCARLWFNPVITWNGKVVPCCFDKNTEHVMGDLNENSFRDIWEGPKYRLFRKSIMTGRYMIEMCRNCTSGLKGVRI